MKKEKSCGAVIYRIHEESPEILLIQHKNGGHWAFPKGHVEGNETEEETALREIREETSLEVRLDSDFRQVVTYSPKRGVSKDVVYFSAQYMSGVPTPQEEEVFRVCWLCSKDALEAVTFDNDKSVLSAFLSQKKFI